MDFNTFNRRQLQSLCKINKIPANITNIAMADALKSLHTEKGEEIETESVLATASRAGCGARRQLAGEGNDFLKTPLVSNARKKGTVTSTSKNTVQGETTVQRVYNTRWSARLTENKSLEAGLTERETSQPVKIASFIEEVGVTSEESVGSGCSSVETTHESSISFEKTIDNVGEESVENCDEGISKANVEEICLELKKLDVVIVDESDIVDIKEEQKVDVDCFGENVDIEEEQKVEEKFILNEPEALEDKKDQVDNIKPDSEGISNLCEVGDSEESMVVIEEKRDIHEHNIYFDLEEQYDNLLCDKVLSGKNSEMVECCGDNVDLEEKHVVEEKLMLNELETSKEKGDQVDNIKLYPEGILVPCENGVSEEKLMVVDEKLDRYEASNVLANELDVCLAQEEHSDSLLCDKIVTEVDGSNTNSISSETENPSLEMTNEVLECNDFTNNNENLCEPPTLDNPDDNNVAMEMAAEPEGIQENISTNTASCYVETSNAFNILFENTENTVWEGTVENCDESILKAKVEEDMCIESEKLDVLIVDGSDHSSAIKMLDYCAENVGFEEKPKGEVESIEAPEEKRDQVDNIKPDPQEIINSCEDGASEEKLMVVDEEIDPHEAFSALLKEHDVYLAPEEHCDNLLCDKVLSGETLNTCTHEADDCSDVDSISCDIENTSNPSGSDIENTSDPSGSDIENTSDPLGSVSEMITCIDPYEELNVSLKEHNVCLASEEHTDNLCSDILLTESDGRNANSMLFMKNEVLECNDSTNDNENPSELSKLDNLDNLNDAKEMTAGSEDIEESISTNTVDKVLMNPNEQEQNKDFGIPEEAQESLIKESALDIIPNMYQQTEEKLVDADKVPHKSVPDVINHSTHLTPIKNPTPVRETSHISDNNENSVGNPLVVSVEDGKIVKKVEDENSTSLNETSMRQLKRQLKALSIKSNMSTNKDEMVADARPVLHPMCENYLAPGEEN